MISILSGYSSDVSWIAGYAIVAVLIILCLRKMQKIYRRKRKYIIAVNKTRNRIRFFYNLVNKTWSNFSSTRKSMYTITLIIVASILFALSHKFHNFLDSFLLNPRELKLKTWDTPQSIEALSNIRRNIWLLGFAIFGGGLAVWARFVSQEQLEKSTEINRNDRFAKAVELLDDKHNDKIATRGGLYMLRDLAQENPKKEYIRCVNIVCHWLLERKDTHASLLNTAVEIFKIKVPTKELEEIMKNSGVRNRLPWERKPPWPNLRGVNMQGADLRKANLSGANLINANLKNVKLLSANLKNARLFNANLRDANLEGVYLEGANLKKAKLQKVNFSLAKMQKASLQEAKLQGASFWAANLEKVNLKGADLKGANLLNAEMKDSKNLNKQQILSAYWSEEHTIEEYEFEDGEKSRMRYMGGEPPELPNKLTNNLKVKKWMNNPVNNKVKKIKAKSKKATAKKATTKKATAKKSTAKKSKS